MNRSCLSYFPFLIIIALFATRCANISSPTGGPKDLLPPAVVKDVPVNGSSSFTGNGFIVTFDEYIVLDKISDKFMVSPPLKKDPEISVRGKNLVVEFDEELKDSTTYTFYFQDAIRDLNEGNPIPNYQFVLSTGNVVDSLSVTGNVFNASDLEAGADFLILMHRQLDDSVPRKVLPNYITKTDKDGVFRINNVKAGEYKLYALSDNNNNMLFDMRTEVFAFSDSVIEVNVSKNFLPSLSDSVKPKTVTSPGIIPVPVRGEHLLYAFTEPKKSQYMTSSERKQPFSLVYTFAIPLDTARFNFSIAGTPPESYFIEESIKRDTFKIWITDSTIYSKELIESIVKHPFTDTTGMLVYVTDTIPLRFLTPRPVRGVKRAEKLSYTTNLQGNEIKPGTNLLFTAPTPFLQPDTSRIKLFETRDTLLIKVPFSVVSDKSNLCRISLDARLKENSRYLLIIDSAALGDKFGLISDSVGIKFFVREADTYGRLTVNLTGYDKEIIVQLLDTNEKLIRELKRNGEGKVVFPLLENGKYRLKVIYDLDGNGIWTTGDYDNFIKPEPVSYYRGEINIRVNYFLDQDWDISEKNVKDQALRKKVTGS